MLSDSLCLRSYAGELGPKHWPNSRYEYVMKLKQAALNFAKKRWADYILVRNTIIFIVTAHNIHISPFLGLSDEIYSLFAAVISSKKKLWQGLLQRHEAIVTLLFSFVSSVSLCLCFSMLTQTISSPTQRPSTC